jgi:hypothetical protein
MIHLKNLSGIKNKTYAEKYYNEPKDLKKTSGSNRTKFQNWSG